MGINEIARNCMPENAQKIVAMCECANEALLSASVVKLVHSYEIRPSGRRCMELSKKSSNGLLNRVGDFSSLSDK